MKQLTLEHRSKIAETVRDQVTDEHRQAFRRQRLAFLAKRFRYYFSPDSLFDNPDLYEAKR